MFRINARILILPITGLVMLLTIAQQAHCQDQRPPNVILIVTDDQGYGDLGCHGNPVLRTPNLDRLHGQSVRLTNFHVDPTCSPTRAALMTGRYSTRVGVWHTVMGRNMPRPNVPMMPQMFAAAGYRTAILGKWHLGDAYPYRPEDRGFDEVLMHGGGGVGQIPDYWGNDYFDDTYLHNGKQVPFTGYCTDVFFNQAIRFIERQRERPFFVYLATNAPHSPYRVAEDYSKPYENLVSGDQELARFYGMIANIDDNLGRLSERLDELGLADDTILIFMTDNGTSRGVTFTDYRGNEGKVVSGFNAGMRGRKGSPYEGGHRVPCFVRWPAGGISGGRDVPELAAHLDLIPTLAELCALELPSDADLDGRSLVPLLTRPKSQAWPERMLFAHHQELPRPEKYRFGCVMRGSWRLIVRGDLQPSPKFELFDLAKDPQQGTDLAWQQPDLVRSLRAAYESWWEQLAPAFDEDSAITLGSDKQNPIRLTCFDWHGSRHWRQQSVLKLAAENGAWAIDVARPGTYRFTLRRWPAETDAPITSAVDGGKAFQAVKATIRVNDTEKSLPIPAGAKSVDFTLPLRAGKDRLETQLTDAQGTSRGAYYVTAERLGD